MLPQDLATQCKDYANAVNLDSLRISKPRCAKTARMKITAQKMRTEIFQRVERTGVWSRPLADLPGWKNCRLSRIAGESIFGAVSNESGMTAQTKQLSPLLAAIFSIGLVFGIGYLDYATGYETSFFLFYLIPVVFALRFLGVYFAVFISVFSGIVGTSATRPPAWCIHTGWFRFGTRRNESPFTLAWWGC
jgi:hypothetical protein